MPALQALLVSGATAAALAGVFVAGGRFHPARLIMSERSGLAFSAGIAMAYVFIRVMPELSEERETFVHTTTLPTRFEGMAIYGLALLGFMAFYSIDYFGRKARQAAAAGAATPEHDMRIIAFAVYGGLVCYLLLSQLAKSPVALALYAIAMAVHFLITAHALTEGSKGRYERLGRFILALSCMTGWGLSLVTTLPRDVMAMILAFLSGAIIVDSAVAQLPSDEEGGLAPFLAGGLLYSLILIPLG
jgi:hypothetical protein